MNTMLSDSLFDVALATGVMNILNNWLSIFPNSFARDYWKSMLSVEAPAGVTLQRFYVAYQPIGSRLSRSSGEWVFLG